MLFIRLFYESDCVFEGYNIAVLFHVDAKQAPKKKKKNERSGEMLRRKFEHERN